MLTIAVIGRGLSAVSFLAGVLHAVRSDQSLDPAISISVFGTASSRAYHREMPSSLILNHSNTHMGGLNAELTGPSTENYQEYLIEHSDELRKKVADFSESFLDPEAFSPRSLYAYYVEHLFDRCDRVAANIHVSIIHVEQNVDKLIVNEDNTAIVCTEKLKAGGEHGPFDRVFLATGSYYSEKRIACAIDYFDFVTNKTDVDLRGLRVGVIGTGLSAYDIALLALHRGSTSVTSFSRKGLLRAVKVRSAKYVRQVLTEDRILAYGSELTADVFIRLLTEEHALASEQISHSKDFIETVKRDYLSHIPDPLQSLESYIVEYNQANQYNKPVLWRSVLLSLYDRDIHGNEIIELAFQSMSEPEKARFMHCYFDYLTIYNAAMPWTTAQRLLSRLRDKTLSFRAGLIDLGCSDEGPWAYFSDGTKEQYDMMIDATGPSKNLRNSGLLRGLESSGHLTFSEVGALQIDHATSGVIGIAGPSKVLFASASPLTLGAGFCFAVDSIGISEKAFAAALRIVRS